MVKDVYRFEPILHQWIRWRPLIRSCLRLPINRSDKIHILASMVKTLFDTGRNSNAIPETIVCEFVSKGPPLLCSGHMETKHPHQSKAAG